MTLRRLHVYWGVRLAILILNLARKQIFTNVIYKKSTQENSQMFEIVGKKTWELRDLKQYYNHMWNMWKKFDFIYDKTICLTYYYYYYY